MRTIVQIPCLNEEENLGRTIADIMDATSTLEDRIILVIDDGSTDGTLEVARAAGVDYVAQHQTNQGLARAYMTGLAASLNLGAEIIVNTDADNQYRASSIPDLLAPIARKEADVVVGARPIDDIEHFSLTKRRLQRFGTWVVRKLSGTPVDDATSGFRAITRETALRMNSFSDYTYTLETLIQAGKSGLRVVSVDIDTNQPTRPSRLMRSMVQYVFRSAGDILRLSTVYSPMRTYSIAGAVPFAIAVFIGLRYLFLINFVDPTRSHAPSLILAGILAGLAFLLWGLGVIGELMTINRRILEEVRIDQRRTRAGEGAVKGRAEFRLINLKGRNAG